ncbi:hypothetical protein C1141_14065, partial [Vibrio agarivorans]
MHQSFPFEKPLRGSQYKLSVEATALGRFVILTVIFMAWKANGRELKTFGEGPDINGPEPGLEKPV